MGECDRFGCHGLGKELTVLRRPRGSRNGLLGTTRGTSSGVVFGSRGVLPDFSPLAAGQLLRAGSSPPSGAAAVVNRAEAEHQALGCRADDTQNPVYRTCSIVLVFVRLPGGDVSKKGEKNNSRVSGLFLLSHYEPRKV